MIQHPKQWFEQSVTGSKGAPGDNTPDGGLASEGEDGANFNDDTQNLVDKRMELEGGLAGFDSGGSKGFNGEDGYR